MVKNEVLIDANSELHAGIGQHIGYELGAKMVKDFYDKFQEGGSQFIGRAILEKVLMQPDCIGVRIFQGLNENGEMKYVFTGVDSTGLPILEITGVNSKGDLQRIEGLVGDRTKLDGWFNNK